MIPCSCVLRDPEWHSTNGETVLEEFEYQRGDESNCQKGVEPEYQSDDKRECQTEAIQEEDVTRETFSPTVLEYMMRNMTLESCNTDVMLCLKGVEPILHQYKPMLIEKTQLLSLFASTLTHKALLPLRDRLLDYQSGFVRMESDVEQLDPKAEILNPHNEVQKKRIVAEYARKTLYRLPPQELRRRGPVVQVEYVIIHRRDVDEVVR